MKQIIEIVDDKPKDEETYGFNTNKILDSDAIEESKKTEKPRKRGPGRPPKEVENPYSQVAINSYTDIGKTEKKKETFESQIEQKYASQVGLIASIINQTDNIYSNIESELGQYRSKMGYGGKSRNMVMAELQNTQVSLINTKLAAVRELNNIRHKINDLNMKHIQISKESDDENSDKAVMDAYYSIVNATRYGLPTLNAPLHPASINTGVNLQGRTVSTGIVGANGVEVGSAAAPVVGAPVPGQAGMAGLTPVQQRMVLEKNPNIKTVVVYNQSTGDKRFEVIDVTTGRSIPGVERPAQFLLDDMKPDMRNGTAINTNTNMVYPLVIEGTRAFDEL